MSFSSRANESQNEQQVAELETEVAGASNDSTDSTGTGNNNVVELDGAASSSIGAGVQPPGVQAEDVVLEEQLVSARLDVDDEDDDTFHSVPEIDDEHHNVEDPPSSEQEESEAGSENEMEELELAFSSDEDDADEDAENFVIVNYDFSGETDSEESESELERNADITYDRSMPSSHTYLGTDLEDVHGRALFDEGSVITIPAHSQDGVILVPGQVMPLHLTHPQHVAMIRTAMEDHKTIAVLHYRRRSMAFLREAVHREARGRLEIGMTAEILSINSDTPDDPTSMVSAITRGRQRFKLLEVMRPLTGVNMAKVKILPEVRCTEPLDQVVPFSHQRSRVAANKSNRKKVTVHNSCSYLTHWPQWVYNQYSPKCLMEQLKKEIEKQWGSKTFAAMENITCPDQLTYWIADNIPMLHQSKFYFLELNSNVQRLRYQLHLIQKYTNLLCSSCRELIAKKSEVFSLSYDGPMGTYVNNYGSVHETLTVRKAKNLTLIGRPSTEFSWFPGYAWTIVNCHNCGTHKGWKFTSSSLQPKSFYGLTRNGLVPGLSQSEISLDEFGETDFAAFVI